MSNGETVWVPVGDYLTREEAEVERNKLESITIGVKTRITRRVDAGGRIIGWRLECERTGGKRGLN